jgi:hypothetical protein
MNLPFSPFLQVISCQKVPKIFVGDSHQQIYQFRGAVDAMKRVDAAKTLHLNQTFRFGAQSLFLNLMMIDLLIVKCGSVFPRHS